MGFIGSAGVSSWPRHHDRLPGRDGGAVASVPARAGHTLVPAFAIFLLNIADVFTTHRILGLGGRELNPVAGWLIANGWLLATKVGLVAVIGLLAYMAPPRRWVAPALWLMAAFYGSVIAFHIAQLAPR